MAEIANEDLKISFTPISVPSDKTGGEDQGLDSSKIVAIKAGKANANEKAICVSTITLTFAAGGTDCPFSSEGLYTFVKNTVGTIVAGSTKNTADSLPVFLKGDIGTCTGTWTPTTPPGTPPLVCSCILEISDAGQTKVTGE